MAGAYDLVIAGGVEMMSVVPMKVNRMGKDNEGPLFHKRYPGRNGTSGYFRGVDRGTLADYS